MLFLFFHPCTCSLLYLHSFPTRRSSDLFSFMAIDFCNSCNSSLWETSIGVFKSVRIWSMGAVSSIGETAPIDHILDRKSTRLNSSHVAISYAVFCLKKKMKKRITFDQN